MVINRLQMCYNHLRLEMYIYIIARRFESKPLNITGGLVYPVSPCLAIHIDKTIGYIMNRLLTNHRQFYLQFGMRLPQQRKINNE